MFYLGIDQHRKQLTISLRDEQGNVVLRQQVSTCWDRVREFFALLRERCAGDGGFVAIVEVCGFNDWLLKLLVEYDRWTANRRHNLHTDGAVGFIALVPIPKVKEGGRPQPPDLRSWPLGRRSGRFPHRCPILRPGQNHFNEDHRLDRRKYAYHYRGGTLDNKGSFREVASKPTSRQTDSQCGPRAAQSGTGQTNQAST